MYVFKKVQRRKKNERNFDLFIQVITHRHQILLEMIMNQFYQVHRLKQAVVQQVQRNEVLMKVQQQHRIHRVYIRMKIHQVH